MFHVSDWFPTILSLANIPKKTVLGNGHIDGIDQSRALTRIGAANAGHARTEMVYGMIDIRILIFSRIIIFEHNNFLFKF